MKKQLTVSLSTESIQFLHELLAKKIVDSGRNVTLSEIIDDVIQEKSK